jgi:uncharacterized OB-fold protein
MSTAIEPIINSLSRPFWEKARAGEFFLPHCIQSNRFFWPPSPTSPFVTSGETEWRAAAPEGELQSVIIYRRSFHVSLQPRLPYGIGLVQLDAGPRLRVHVSDVSTRDRLHPGDQVRVGFSKFSPQDWPIPVAEKAVR